MLSPLVKCDFLLFFPRTREILNQAILENDFMKNLDTTQVVEIVECMYSVNFATGNTIIREGELGSVVYVMEGSFLLIQKVWRLPAVVYTKLVVESPVW